MDEKACDLAGADRHLQLRVSETIAQSWLPDFVAELSLAFAGLRIEISVDISVTLRAQLLDREIDLALPLGPISDFTVDNVALPEFPLAWYRGAAREPRPDPEAAVDFTRTPVIPYACNTRPFRELRAAPFGRYGPGVSLFPSSSLSSCFRLVEAGWASAPCPDPWAPS